MEGFSIECNICCEPFKENGPKSPYLLICGHTFCFNCLSSLKSTFNNDSTTSTILCPTCREPTSYSVMHPLRRNYQLIELLSQFGKFSTMKQSSTTTPINMINNTSNEEQLTNNELPIPSAPPIQSYLSTSTSSTTSTTTSTTTISNNNRITVDERINHCLFNEVKDEIKANNSIGIWWSSLWFKPGKFTPHVVGGSMEKRLIPHWLFNCTIHARIQAVEEVTINKITNNNEINTAVIRKPYNAERELKKKAYCVCAIKDDKERGFIDSNFQGTWDLTKIIIFDNELVVPTTSMNIVSYEEEIKAEKERQVDYIQTNTIDPLNNNSVDSSSIAAPTTTSSITTTTTQEETTTTTTKGGGGGFIKFIKSMFGFEDDPGNKVSTIAPEGPLIEHLTSERVWIEVYKQLTEQLKKTCETHIEELNSSAGGRKIVSSRIDIIEETTPLASIYESRLVYLPMWYGRYTYEEDTTETEYFVYINGQTGIVQGTRPWMTIIDGFSKLTSYFSSTNSNNSNKK
jgi:hypothetical protein